MTDEVQPLSRRYDQVIVGSGHMIDAPDRKEPRFPEEKAEAVRALIAARLAEWKVNSNDLAICGGASGADTLFGEECLERGASLRLLLAQEVEDFVRDSVQPAGGNWVERFHALKTDSDVAVLPAAASSESEKLSIYERTNLWIIETARQAAAQGGGVLRALLVWDEKETGDGPGGTSDFGKRMRDLGGEVVIINPTKLTTR